MTADSFPRQYARTQRLTLGEPRNMARQRVDAGFCRHHVRLHRCALVVQCRRDIENDGVAGLLHGLEGRARGADGGLGLGFTPISVGADGSARGGVDAGAVAARGQPAI